jgi:hypothetical protein
MSFDNSRFTFNPWNDYLGVRMQQGRVQLDSDWNEWLSEFARRIQAGSLDILGLAGVPASTPYGFKINAYQDAAGNHLTIGAGRMYVDGLLIENRGPVGQAQWDRSLAEWSGAPPGAAELDVDYGSQPYLPGATIPGNGPFLVYLDVWQREVTYLEDPDLVDKAVGVDTTGRLQTVWQVKLLDISGVAGGVTCSTPDSAIQSAGMNWGNLTQPPSGLLITGVVPSSSSGPCALTPATGYSGLENQLYRIEIHQGGSTTSTPPATFKWSREDASIATGVLAISTVTNSVGATASRLTVQSMGRDQVLGFNPGDWIEIIDDHLELNPPIANGQAQPGELHRIDSINPAANFITLDTTVSSANFPVGSANQTDPGRHTRIRRWDQSGTVFAYQNGSETFWVDLDTAGSSGIPVPPADTPLILENGITVAFEGTSFRTGDHWTFAARTADGSVEVFNQPAAAQSQSPPPNAWNAATSYTPGQIVASAGTYFVCLAANTGQAPPNAAFWSPQTPPAGTHHHYRRLATVDFTAKPPKVTDCRRIFQPLANPCIHVTNILLGANPLLNDSTVTIQALANGIMVVCDLPIDSAIITQPTTRTQLASAWNATTTYNPGQVVTIGGNFYVCIATNLNKTPPNAAFWAVAQFNCPICFVTVDLPITTGPPSGGFNPIILTATVSVASNTLNWIPTPAAQTALLNQISPGAPPLLARLTLKGNFIWAHDNPGVYLNGASLGMLNTATGPQANLQLPTGDGRRFADFELWFWLVSQPVVTLSANAINFSTPQVVGTASSAQSVTLTNNSTTTPLTFPATGISVSGPNAGDFNVTNTCGASVPPGASCTITVTFTPTAAGTRTAQINISESADTNPLVISLTGTAIQPLLTASVTNLVFPAQIVGSISVAQIVTLTNPGSSQLTISSVAIEGTDYALTSTCSGTLQPGQQCTVSVQFEPTAAGTRSAQLQVQSNAPGSPLPISLTGTGVAGAPGVNASPTSLAFGSVLTTSSSAQSLTLTSTGNTALTITQIQIIGTNASSFSQTNNCGSTLQPTQQCSITVTFKPSTIGVMSAQLQIFHNAPGSPLNIPLSGTGLSPKDRLKDISDAKHGTVDKVQKDSEVISRPGGPVVGPQVFSTPAGGISPTRTAFITPEERPSVGPQV